MRIWNYRERKITKTIDLVSPDGNPAQGTMDVKMLLEGPARLRIHGGHVRRPYLPDRSRTGTRARSPFDLSTVKPHVDSATTGGMGQIMAVPQSGDRLIIGTFMAGQVVMLDTTDRSKLKQVSVVSFGENSGPHNIVLSSDDSRLVVTDYFLNEDAEGIIHFEGDHKVHVLKVTHNTLTEDKRFKSGLQHGLQNRPGASPWHCDEIALQCSVTEMGADLCMKILILLTR